MEERLKKLELKVKYLTFVVALWGVILIIALIEAVK